MINFSTNQRPVCHLRPISKHYQVITQYWSNIRRQQEVPVLGNLCEYHKVIYTSNFK